jgi:hypothetical protein
MDNVYDNIAFSDSAVPQSFSGSSAVNGSAVDTKGFNSAVIKASGAAASGSPSTATLAVKLQESADGSTGWADALDTTGTAIGFTLTVTAANASNLARIEALGTTRKRYLRAVVTPAFTSGTSPAALGFAEIVLGNPFSLPANTAASNT